MEPTAKRPLRGRRFRVDPLLTGCVLALIAFPVLAWIAAAGLPVEPRPQAPRVVASGADGEAGSLRQVPVFEDAPDLAAALAGPSQMRSALRAGMTEVLDPPAVTALLRLVESDATVTIKGGESVDPLTVPYPYRYPAIERLLPTGFEDPARANDLGALLILAAAGFEGESLYAPFPNAGFAAFAVLDRARSGDACAPQLNLAFLLSADTNPRDDDVAREYQLAADRCGGDPTPLWLLAQFQSQRAFIRDNADRPGQELEREDRLQRPFDTVDALQRSHPGLAAAWAAEADAELRIAYQMDPLQPFGSRQRFRRALALYQAARRLDDDPELAAGEARALAGLHLYRRAAAVQRAASAGLDGTAPVKARLVEYLERAGSFSAAADAAADLEASHEFPPYSALLMKIAHDDGENRLSEEDAEGPVSTGVAQARAVRLHVGPFPGGVGGPGADVSFIPLFRDVDGVTGHDRWCPGWAHRRDLVLAGRAREALDEMPAAFTEVNPDNLTTTCAGSFGIPLLAAVAELEAGDRAAAVSRLRQRDAKTLLDGRDPVVALRDAQQNLWRFAGDYERAASAAAAWTQAYPEDPDALDRAGEIAFLDGRFAEAARWFGEEVRAARSVHGVWTAQEARAQLKQGTALSRLGRHDEALDVLTDAEETASRARAFAKDNDDYQAEVESEFFTYHALAQAGDAALLAKRYDAASERYAVAADFVPRLTELPIDREPLARPEVLFNNWALADTKAGDAGTALAAARRAVEVDPANPLFRGTEGLTLQQLGRGGEAVGAYRAAVASDPSDFPAWNNLGVALDDPGAAVDALRRAVGARDDYALGWFNLGVALEQEGPLHALASQGALGRAIRLDGGLRDREHDPVLDEDVYVTNLDLSKPLPPEWGLSQSQERAPVAAAGFALALILGLRLARSLAGQGTASDAGRRLYEAVRTWIDRIPAALRLPRAAIAVLATITVFLLPMLLSGPPNVTAVVLLVLGTGLLIVVVLRARVLAARRAGVELEQRTWSPAVAFGLVAGALGAPWAPMPVARTSQPSAVVHWVGPLLMCVSGSASWSWPCYSRSH